MASQFCHRNNRNGTKTSRETKIYGSRQSPYEGHVESQFKKWVSDWHRRVFMDRLINPKELCYFFNQDQYHLIQDLVECYHETCSEQIGQDRFAWTTFACAIIKEHRHQAARSSRRHTKCQINRSLFVLLWISFYLRLPCSELVKEILREIITCTGNLRFMFSFLPGMSIYLFTSLLWTKPIYFEEKLCREYFSLIDTEINASSVNPHYKDVFKLSQPFLLYLVQHLTPLHTQSNPSPTTLQEILNKPLLPERKYTMLTLAIHYYDKDLVTLLLKLGASAQTHYWDSCTESSISAERIMISSVNSFMGSRQFLISVNKVFKELTEYMDSVVDTISTFAPLVRRSVFRSEQRKSSHLWSSEDSTYELNREIADRWGIDCEWPCPSLQHICKIQIRQHILQADKELLPYAVQKLPLPNKMIKYLNLQLD